MMQFCRFLFRSEGFATEGLVPGSRTMVQCLRKLVRKEHQALVRTEWKNVLQSM